MGLVSKKNSAQTDESTIENRVYVFRDLAAAWLSKSGELLASEDEGTRNRSRQALADLAFAACLISDTEDKEAAKVGRAMARGLGLTPDDG